ncbi:MAG: carboxypeptidase regulatory-like domain-containing protein [Bryobacteraceae bacterium]|nr:carboxypeptidase regulatory-like domain-containing protein [Bryobacteraceae bacterium]
MEEFPPLLKPALAFALLCALAAGAAPPDRKKGAPQSFAVVAGSVFHESGRSLPGARILVTPKPPATEESRQPKGYKAVTDSRGEFAVRVPAGSMRYTVSVDAKGFHPEEKEAAVSWDERVDLFFRLRPIEGEAGESR